MARFFTNLALFVINLYCLVTSLSSSTSSIAFFVFSTDSSEIKLDFNLKEEKRKPELESNQEHAEPPPKKD